MTTLEPINTQLAFQTHQRAFTQWIRHPDTVSLPNGISAQRMNTYRDLIFNNIESFVEHSYPITKALLPKELWRHLIEAFFQYGQCDSPYYYDISLHFKDFLEQDTFNRDSVNRASSEDTSRLNHLKNIHNDYPWLRELMQYEWMELFVEIAEVEWLNDVIDLQLKTTCWILAYQYPVHTWSVNTTIEDINVQPTCLLVYRDPNFITQVYTLHPLWAFIIETLQTQESIHVVALQTLVEQTTLLPTIEVQNVLANIFSWLQTLNLLQETRTQSN
ncbi:MAG: putative DNA-binding domain-containing protein [Candidatus Saccharibacteria bacterium]|nr:putative DNA-binding domain-containing protein [Moraxellaceae bacterium]